MNISKRLFLCGSSGVGFDQQTEWSCDMTKRGTVGSQYRLNTIIWNRVVSQQNHVTMMDYVTFVRSATLPLSQHFEELNLKWMMLGRITAELRPFWHQVTSHWLYCRCFHPKTIIQHISGHHFRSNIWGFEGYQIDRRTSPILPWGPPDVMS